APHSWQSSFIARSGPGWIESRVAHSRTMSRQSDGTGVVTSPRSAPFFATPYDDLPRSRIAQRPSAISSSLRKRGTTSRAPSGDDHKTPSPPARTHAAHSREKRFAKERTTGLWINSVGWEELGQRRRLRRLPDAAE